MDVSIGALFVRLMGIVFVLGSAGCFDVQNASHDSTRSTLTKSNGGAIGDDDYCDDGPNTCGVGEGDCDSDAQCQGDLVCAHDVGHLFGFPSSVDFCWAAHCDNGVQDGDEEGVDCGGSCGFACCDGDGSFAQVSTVALPVYSDPWQIDSGDLNGDHIPDLVTANRKRVDNAYAISVLVGNGVNGRGDGTYQAPQPFLVGDLPVALRVVDLDHDGATDIISANQNSDTLSILWSSGAEELQFTRQDLSLAPVAEVTSPRQISVVDVDNDSDLDIVCVNWRDNSIAVFFRPGNTYL